MQARPRAKAASLFVPVLVLGLASTQDSDATASLAAANPQVLTGQNPQRLTIRTPQLGSASQAATHAAAASARTAVDPVASPRAAVDPVASPRAAVDPVASPRAAVDPVASARTADDSLALLERQEQKASSDLQALSQAEDQIRRRLIARGRIVYRLVKAGVLPAGSGFAAFVEHAMRLGRARWALDQDLSRLKRVADQRSEISRRLEEISVHKAPLQLEREAALRARTMIEEAEDRRRAFEHAFERSTGAGDYVAVYGGGIGPDEPFTAETFRQAKGKLPFPVTGRAEVKVVRRENAAGPGVEMSAPEGSVVKAVFAGRVAFADKYDGFGQIVILDHGDRYYTLMGNLGSIDVRVGDDLSAGARVGTVGQGSSGPVLYFEIRRGASTLDPKPWFGI